jgi:8-oxo-dGTP pyrophosphatase MutT (NUDIX family)
VTALDDVAAAFGRRPPRVRAASEFAEQAAVSLVLCPEAADLSLLFIKRREHPDDRWSGHTAFPGGRIDPGDADARAAALRETLEEVGLDLAQARPLGRLDDLTGRSASLVVSGFVYGLPAPRALDLNYEVDAARFMPLAEIEDTARHVHADFDYRDMVLALPAIQVFEPPALPLWGLSYRFLEQLMRLLGRPIPAMPWDESL